MPKHRSIKDAVAAADRQPIVESLERLKSYWEKGRWLGANNRYRQETSQRVKDDNGSFRDSDLAEYIGASTLGHCFDGWSYLGRATEAELAGDPGSARHLGYYAELRAAMSLLAGNGIGIFNDSHVSVERNGTCWRFGNGTRTHTMIWQVLEEWAKSTVGSDRVLEVINPGGVSLATWVGQFGGSAQFVTQNWLEKWGLDLARLAADRDARNVASYRPTSLSGAPPVAIGQAIASIDHLWTLCAPRGGGGFTVMDRHLLRQVLVQLFDHRGNGLQLRGNSQKYVDRVDRMLDAMAIGSERKETARFLKFESDPGASPLLTDSNGKVGPNHLDHSKQVLARATLLLRLATGTVSNLLKSSGMDFEEDLKFWWNGDSVRRRLWSDGVVPESFADLWADVETALDEADEWLNSGSADMTHWGFWNDRGRAGWTLSTVERVFLWGLA